MGDARLLRDVLTGATVEAAAVREGRGCWVACADLVAQVVRILTKNKRLSQKREVR
jgi:hypothetical protein